MAGVWGRGGLFEQAVQQKYANQGMNAATDRMNADTNRMKAGNDLTLGLRGADIEQMNANTNRFNADTTRGRLAIDSAGRGPNSGEINSFQLGNSFRPDTSASSTASRPTSYFSGTSSSGTSTFGDSASGLRAFGVDKPEEKKFGFRNSGVVMKPRMVRQPGYKNSGKVMGYADSGAAKDPAVIPDKYSEIRQQISELAKQGDIDGATDLRMKLEAMESGRVKPGYSNSGQAKVWPGVDPAAPVVKTPREIMDEQFRRNVEASRTGGDMQQFLKAPRVPVKLFENGGSAEGGLRSPKSFGPIGNVEDDTGRDTIDAKVRPGEYLLNPETVENGFGDGDYDKGVRRLDNIVRRATGKEPGPTMMSDDKPGFANSGAQAEFDFGSEERARAEALRREAARSQGFGARAANVGRAAADSVRNAGSAATNSVRGVGAGVNRVLDMSVSEAAKRASQAGVEAVKAAGRGAGAVLKAGTTGLGRVAVPIAAGFSAAQTYDTPTEEYYARTGIDPNAEDGNYLDSILPPESSGNPYANAIRDSVGFLGDKQFLKDAGVRSLGALQDLGNTLTFGLADRLGNFDGFERSSYYQDAPAAPAKSAQAGPNTTGVASFMQEVADGGASAGAAQQPAAEKQPSLRDFLESQYRELAADKSFVGSAWRKDQMKNIGDMINNMDQTAAVTGSADAKALAKAQKDNAESVEKMISEGFTRREVDPETGEIKESQDMEAANEFRRFVLANANELGVPVSMLDPYQVMSLMKDFETRRGVRDMVNRQAGDISSGVVSRELLRPDEVIGTDELSLRDTLPFFGSDSSASFFGDYVPSIFSGGDADQVAVVKRGGKTMRIPLEELIRRSDGSVNEDVLAQFPQLRPPYR